LCVQLIQKMKNGNESQITFIQFQKEMLSLTG